ncbi:hypothetical protein GF324_09100 [bacterium]|nr:hypothetical protein [bacterium]
MAVRGKLYYVMDDLQDKIDQIISEFERDATLTPEQLMEALKKLLPIEKADFATAKRRVEGMYLVAERLFNTVYDLGRFRYGDEWTRGRVTREAELRPFHHFHWTTGSREPQRNVLTRDDFLNDPATALIKLESDISSLAQLMRHLQSV